MAVWVVRAGRVGERDQWCLDNGYAGGGFHEVADLTLASTREAVRKLVEEAFSNGGPALHANFTGQLHAFRNKIAAGDLVVLPLKTTKHLALGRVTGGYKYLADTQDADRRHVIEVEWQRTDVSRSAILQDLLYSLGAFLTICKISRNDGAWRIAQVLKTGTDPGARTGTAGKTTPTDVDDPSDETVAALDVVQVASDRVRIAVGERFAGHEMSRLVGEVLAADGFVCDVSPPGPDAGVDIVAGRGVLGLDEPKLVVQVKSQTSQVGVEVINQLLGARSALHADQALLVAWGGLTKPARELAKSQRFILRVWEADDLVTNLLDVYPRSNEEIRTKLPLQQVWVVAEASG